ncbi:MAG: hypothetical protein HY075_08780 [Deltaproteobacteria bacterium]|nr:hypothetical protein [Deltaproteobacteria bacterium]
MRRWGQACWILSTALAVASFPGFAAAEGAPAAGGAPDDCEGYRLDWVTGGPFNPEPLATSSKDYAVCSGEPDKEACKARHKGDGKQHDYVIVHDQGVNGTCTFQALAGVLNYNKSMKGEKPTVSPEYLASQDCDNFLPGHGIHDIPRALSSYNKSGSCTREDLACVANGGELSETLESAYFTSAITSSTLALQGFGTKFDPNEKAKSQICTTVLKDGLSDDKSLALARDLAAATDKISEEGKGIDRLTDNLSKQMAIQKNTTAGISGDTAKSRAAEYSRCTADAEFFKQICKDKIEKPPADKVANKPKVPADACKTKCPWDGIAAECSKTFKDKAPGKVTEDFLASQARKSKDAETCIMGSSDMGEMRQQLLNNQIADMEKTGKPVILDVNDMSRLVGKSQKRSDAGHAVVLIGRQRINGECGYWVRNSWGTQCPSKTNPDVHCDPDRPGNVWISSAKFESDAGVKRIFDPGL